MPDEASTYFIQWRRPPGPWQARNLPGAMVNLNEAIRSAQALLQNQPGQVVRVLDNTGRVHWCSEVTVVPANYPFEDAAGQIHWPELEHTRWSGLQYVGTPETQDNTIEKLWQNSMWVEQARSFVEDQFKRFAAEHDGKDATIVVFSTRMYAVLLHGAFADKAQPPPLKLFGATVFIRNDPTKPEVELL